MAKRVFLSYSHDSDRHASIVRNLVDRLRRDGRFWPIAVVHQEPEQTTAIGKSRRSAPRYRGRRALGVNVIDRLKPQPKAVVD